MERRDRRQRVGQVVEDDHEVGLDECRRRGADRVGVGQRHARLEGRDRVIRERADGAARESGQPLARLDLPARHEGANRLERIRRRCRPGRQARVVAVDADGPVLDRRPAVANFEEPPRANPEERIAPEPLPALDGFEEIGGRRPVVESEERPDRGLEVGGTRGAQEQRVRARRESLRLGQAQRVHRHVWPPGITNGLRPPGTKGRAFRGATLIRRCRTLPGPLPLAFASGSRVHFFVVAVPAHTSRRISRSARDGYSSRSQPVLRDVGGSLGARLRRRQATFRRSEVAALGVAPGEAFAGRHLEDHRVILCERVGPSMAGLRLTAADVAAVGTEAEVVIGSALLADTAARRGDGRGSVGANRPGRGRRELDVHHD